MYKCASLILINTKGATVEDIRGHFPSSPIQLCLFSFIPIFNTAYNISPQHPQKINQNFLKILEASICNFLNSAV